jgi:hypothetical protein
MILVNLRPTAKRGALSLVHIELSGAQEAVRVWHRHSDEVVGHRFSLGATDEHGRLVGVAICGRPEARALPQLGEDAWLYVARVATDGTKNACSFLYAASIRAARALGYKTVMTYTEAGESGASLRAAGFTLDEALPDRGGARRWSTETRQRHAGDLVRVAEARGQATGSVGDPVLA